MKYEVCRLRLGDFAIRVRYPAAAWRSRLQTELCSPIGLFSERALREEVRKAAARNPSHKRGALRRASREARHAISKGADEIGERSLASRRSDRCPERCFPPCLNMRRLGLEIARCAAIARR